MAVRNKTIVFILAWFFILSGTSVAETGDYHAYRVLMHVHTHVSGDNLSFDVLAYLSEQEGVDALILTDYFQQKISWPPPPKKLRLWHSRDSILKYGVDKYYEEVEEANRAFPNVLFIPGAEVMPSYMWTGQLLKGTKTIRNSQKNILVFGYDAKNLAEVPTLENGGPFEKPYQTVIDDANEHGGISIWSTPDEAFGAHFKVGPIKFATPPYNQSLKKTYDYTGIAIFPEGYIETGIVGGIWDKLLLEYCKGIREKPIWAFAESVLHQKSIAEDYFARWDNIVYAENKTEPAILDSMKMGKFYIRRLAEGEIYLREFQVMDSARYRAFGMGEEVKIAENPRIKVKVWLEPDAASEKFLVQIIRNGEVLHAEIAKGKKVELDYTDSLPLPKNQKSYYRIFAHNQAKKNTMMLSNPIFVSEKSYDFDF